jgi:hypothetical protein
MSLVATITTLSERWLTERTFELIVAPAIADMQFDEAATGLRRMRNGAAVISAFLWGLYEEVASDPGGLLTFLVIALIPTCYYTMLIAVCAPVRGRPMSYPVTETGFLIAIGLAVFALSLAPALVCCWPSRPERTTTTEG